MGTWTRETHEVDCGSDHTPGGVRCPGHTVGVSLHRSSDMTTLMVGGDSLVMPDALATALFDLWAQMQAEAA